MRKSALKPPHTSACMWNGDCVQDYFAKQMCHLKKSKVVVN